MSPLSVKPNATCQQVIVESSHPCSQSPRLVGSSPCTLLASITPHYFCLHSSPPILSLPVSSMASSLQSPLLTRGAPDPPICSLQRCQSDLPKLRMCSHPLAGNCPVAPFTSGVQPLIGSQSFSPSALSPSLVLFSVSTPRVLGPSHDELLDLGPQRPHTGLYRTFIFVRAASQTDRTSPAFALQLSNPSSSSRTC